MRALEAAISGLVLAVLAFGLALLPLLTPAFTAALSERYSEYGPGVAVLAEASRDLVVNRDPAARAVVSAVMEPDAVEHLDDVAAVILNARAATLVLAVLAGVWVAWCVWERRLRALGSGLRVGGVVVLAAIAVAAVAGTTDFDVLFARFHQLFFAEGTWIFPADSVLIRVFPEPFWIAAGAAWAIGTALVAVAYLVAARVVLRRAGE